MATVRALVFGVWPAAIGNCWVSICTTMRVVRCRCGTMDGCMRRPGVPARRVGRRSSGEARAALRSPTRECRPRGGDDSTRFASPSPGHQLPLPAVVPIHRPAADVGPALAGARHARPVDRRTRRAARHPGVVRQVGAGGAGDRLRHRHVDAGDGQGRAGHRRGRRRGLPARAGPAAERDRPRKRSPTSGWSAATASTCWSTCSPPSR